MNYKLIGILGIIAAVLFFGIGAWYYTQVPGSTEIPLKGAVEIEESRDEIKTQSSQPVVTIDIETLSTSSLSPTITGTAIGATSLIIWLATPGDEYGPGEVFWRNESVQVVSGKWSITPTIPSVLLGAGNTASLRVLVYKNTNSTYPLASGTLEIEL